MDEQFPPLGFKRRKLETLNSRGERVYRGYIWMPSIHDITSGFIVSPVIPKSVCVTIKHRHICRGLVFYAIPLKTKINKITHLPSTSYYDITYIHIYCVEIITDELIRFFFVLFLFFTIQVCNVYTQHIVLPLTMLFN